MNEIFEAFNGLRVAVVGDVMLDSYVFGKADRLSPEAPVPVVVMKSREYRLGGAGNVLLNLKALGAKPILFSVIGDDSAGETLLGLMADNALDTSGVFVSSNRPTTVKERVISGGHQLLRIDTEQDTPLSEQESATLFEALVASERPDVIVFQDYDKGVLSENLIQNIVAFAQKEQIPTVTDPKKRNFLHYKGVTLFKPNLKELSEGLGRNLTTASIPELTEAISIFKQKMQIDGIFLTLSERGVLIDFQGEAHHIPAHLRKISDVSGAGDTVVSIAACAVALGLPPRTLAQLANLGGGLVCEELGVVPINKTKLLEEALRLP